MHLSTGGLLVITQGNTIMTAQQTYSASFRLASANMYEAHSISQSLLSALLGITASTLATWRKLSSLPTIPKDYLTLPERKRLDHAQCSINNTIYAIRSRQPIPTLEPYHLPIPPAYIVCVPKGSRVELRYS